jgi:hypothetical protein
MQGLGVKMAHWRTEDIPTFTSTFGDMKQFSDNQYLCHFFPSLLFKPQHNSSQDYQCKLEMKPDNPRFNSQR